MAQQIPLKPSKKSPRKRSIFTFFSSITSGEGIPIPLPSPRDYGQIKHDEDKIILAYKCLSKKRLRDKHYQMAADILSEIESNLNFNQFENFVELSSEQIERLITKNPNCGKALAQDPRISHGIHDFSSLLKYLKMSPFFSILVLQEAHYAYLNNGEKLASIFIYIKKEASKILFNYGFHEYIENDYQMILAAQHLSPKTMDALLIFPKNKNLLIGSYHILDFILHAPQQVELLQNNDFYRNVSASKINKFLEEMEIYAGLDTEKSAETAFALAKIYHHGGYANIHKNPQKALSLFRLAKEKGHKNAGKYLTNIQTPAKLQKHATL